jgi:uncharacterized membrane protein (GlpM family)
MTELALRFVLGGAVVSIFSGIGEAFQPKSFSGLFGAAPSVAIASLAMLFASHGAHEVAIAAMWMLVATIAFYAYATSCAVATERRRIPEWVVAFGSWSVWFAVAAALWFALRWSIAR